MTRDLQRYLRALDMMRPQLGTMMDAVDLLNTSGVADAIRQMQRQQAEVNQALSLVNKTAWKQDIFLATRHLNELSQQMASTLGRAHHSWLAELRDVTEQSTQLATIAKMTVSDISHHLATSKAFGDYVDFDSLRKTLSIQPSIMADVQRSMTTFKSSYRQLVESLRSGADIVEMPAFVLPGATQEVSMGGYALKVLHPGTETEEREEVEAHSGFGDTPENPNLIALLGSVGMGLVDTYRGAVQALNGDNPDRSRHVLSSLRTLLDHLIRKLAPKHKVREWVVERGYDSYLHNGIPTRRAQILYISKDIENEPLTKFIEADTKTVEELYSLYNRLHGIGTGISDLQLRAIVLRTESYLEYTLRVREW